MLRSISDFCPPGTQIRNPGGLVIDPEKIVGIEANGHYRNDRTVTIYYGGGDKTTIEFYDNTDGSAASHYQLMRNIQAAAGE